MKSKMAQRILRRTEGLGQSCMGPNIGRQKPGRDEPRELLEFNSMLLAHGCIKSSLVRMPSYIAEGHRCLVCLVYRAVQSGGLGRRRSHLIRSGVQVMQADFG
jgi:hypothetical protein